MSLELATKPPATVTSEPQKLEVRIRVRAYELYEDRGRENGCHLEDWVRTEEEITVKNVRTIAAFRPGNRQSNPGAGAGCYFGIEVEAIRLIGG